MSETDFNFLVQLVLDKIPKMNTNIESLSNRGNDWL